MNRKLKTIIVLICGIFIFMCSNEENALNEDIIDSGKRIHNITAEWGNTPRVGLDLVRKIGVLESENENYMLHRPNDIALDANGNIFILDAGNFRVQKFSPEGKFLNTFGSRGQGPGELSYPLSLEIDDQGNLLVSDLSNNRISVYSQNGKYLRSFKMGSFVSAIKLLPSGDILSGGSSTGGLVSLSAPMIYLYSSSGSGGNISFSGDISGTIEIKSDDDESDEDVKKDKPQLVKVYDPQGEYKSSFCPPFEYNNMMMNSMGNGIFTAVGPDNSVYVAFRYQNRIEKYKAGGELVFNADRPLNYEITGPMEKEEESTKITEIITSSGNMAFSINTPEFNKVSQGIGVDSKNRIWVMTYVKQYDKESDEEPELQIEIFNDRGRLLCVLPWQEDFIPTTNSIHMFGNQVFFFDNEGVSVYEYKIKEIM